VLFWNKALPEN